MNPEMNKQASIHLELNGLRVDGGFLLLACYVLRFSYLDRYPPSTGMMAPLR
jgi:hypothetical protein